MASSVRGWVLVLCLLGLSCRLSLTGPDVPQALTYTNPVVTPVAADPSVLRGPDGRFYLFATNDDWGDGQGLRILPIFTSSDLVAWEFIGTVFSEKPAWKAEGGLWAPDISYRAGRYDLYYSYSTWGDPNPCIGLATAAHPAGPWTDLGRPVFCSDSIGVENSIDPFVWDEDDRRLLVWGSFHGIYVIPLSPDGSRPDGEKKRLADHRFEGAYVHVREGTYYLFVSAGTCCEGAQSTYRVYVGRSDSLTGPYVDAEGKDLRQGGGTLVLTRSDTWAGPGHNSIVTDDAGVDWIVYHAIPVEDPNLPGGAPHRPALIDRLVWDEAGWPSVSGRRPSTTPQPAPVIQPRKAER